MRYSQAYCLWFAVASLLIRRFSQRKRVFFGVHIHLSICFGCDFVVRKKTETQQKHISADIAVQWKGRHRNASTLYGSWRDFTHVLIRVVVHYCLHLLSALDGTVKGNLTKNIEKPSGTPVQATPNTKQDYWFSRSYSRSRPRPPRPFSPPVCVLEA